MLRIILAPPMNVTDNIYLLAIVAMPIDHAYYTAGHVFSAHAHKLPGRDLQMYAYTAVLGPAMF